MHANRRERENALTHYVLLRGLATEKIFARALGRHREVVELECATKDVVDTQEALAPKILLKEKMFLVHHLRKDWERGWENYSGG